MTLYDYCRSGWEEEETRALSFLFYFKSFLRPEFDYKRLQHSSQLGSPSQQIQKNRMQESTHN